METESSSSGYFAELTPDVSAAIRVSTNTVINAVNKPIPPFAVEKEWYSLEDPANYPEIRFTLYQARISNGQLQQGTVFVDGSGVSYDNIPLGINNNWHWDCPVYLPPKDAEGYDVGYYVQENTSGNNSGHVLLYQNSTFDSNGHLVTLGEALASGEGEKYDVKPLDYYNDQNSNHAKTNDQNFPNGWAGGIAGNTGKIIILNRAPKYIQMDIKKKILTVDPTDGHVDTVMDDADVQKNIVLEIQLMRRVIDERSGSDVFLTDWEPYGQPFMIGFDGSGNPIQQNPNHFVLEWQGGFFWRIVLNTTEADQYGFAQNVGLPAYGYYKQQDGTVIPVRYRYIPEEIGAYRNFGRDPMLNGFEWFVGYQPSAWDGNGSQVKTFPAMLPNHDQDRIKNIQGSNLFVEKDWEGITTNIQEVYVKLYRSFNGEQEDVTKDIYDRMSAYSGYGLVDISKLAYLNTTNGSGAAIGAVLVFRPGDDPIEIHKLPLIHDQTTNYGVDPYYYWIEEVAYKDKNGTIQTDSSKFAAEYDKYVNGAWQNAWSSNAQDNKMSLGSLTRNRLRANNYATMDFKAEKKWVGANGENLTGPWEANPAITSVNFKVTRIAQKYVNDEPSGDPIEAVLTFGGSQNLAITATGKKVNVAVQQAGGTVYTISSQEDISTGWQTEIVGLQQTYKDRATGDVWHYTYKITEENNIPNCITSITGSPVTTDGQTVTITNTKVEASLEIEKVFADGTTLTDEQKNAVTFTVTAPDGHNLKNGAVNVSFLTKTYADFINGKWVLTQVDGIEKGVTYTVTETNVDFEGMTRTTTYQVNSDEEVTVAADAVSIGGSVLVSSETGTGKITFTNSYESGISINVTKDWKQKVAGTDTFTDKGKDGDTITFTLHQILTHPDTNAVLQQEDDTYTGVSGHVNGSFTLRYDATNTRWETVTIPNLPKTEKRTITATPSDGDPVTEEVIYNASYYVVEDPISADAGYILATTYSNSTQGSGTSAVSSGKDAAVSTNGATITIINTETPGVELPATGGPGTALYTVTGLTLTLGAALWLILSRRKREQN